jgi:hypothetical protein
VLKGESSHIHHTSIIFNLQSLILHFQFTCRKKNTRSETAPKCSIFGALVEIVLSLRKIIHSYPYRLRLWNFKFSVDNNFIIRMIHTARW